MKKLFALLLLLAMLFCLTACSFIPSTDDCASGHVDKDGDEKCDVCKKAMPNDDDDDDDDDDGDSGDGGNGGGNIDDSYLAPTISEAIAAQLEAASSMKIDFSFSADSLYDGYNDYYDENGELVVEEYDDVDKVDVELSLILSKTESGFNLMLTAEYTEYYEGEDEPDVEKMSAYLIDGSFYQYDEDLGAYVETMIPSLDGLMSTPSTPAAVTEMLSALLAQLEISEEDRDALISGIGEIITGIFEIVDKKGDFNIDFKPYLDDLFAYVEGIDVETKTLESLIDDILHLADEELSVEALLDEIKSLASLTVAEALTELDAWLTENHETTIQGIYDTIVADERVEQLVRTYMGMLGVPEGDDPITEADIQAFLDELRAVKVDEFIAAYVDTDMVLYDFIMTLISSMGGSTEPAPEPNPNAPGGSYEDDGFVDIGTMPVGDELEDEEPSYPPINTLFGVIADYLDLTLAEVEESMGASIFTTMKESFAGVTINALSTSSSISFTDTFALSELSFGAKVDVATSLPYEIDNTKTVNTAFKLDFDFKISSISDSTVDIALPENSEVIFGIFNVEELFSDETGTYALDLNWPSVSEEDGSLTLSGWIDSADAYIQITGEFSGEKQDTYTFDYIDYLSYASGKLSITFDYEAMTYSLKFIG